jgi:anaerobic magnesium-protoporphyrin IX monomethyl ester cyclase
MIYFIRSLPVLRNIELIPIDDILLNYAATALEREEVDFSVIDLHLDASAPQKLDRITSTDICLFPVRQYDDQIHLAAQAARHLRTSAPSVKILYFGHTKVAADFLLINWAADYVITGEERELIQIVRRLEKGERVDNCPGVAYCANGRKVVHNPPAHPLVPFERLPAPSRYALSMGLLPFDHPYTTVELQSSRGCYARCTYCYIDAMRRTFATNYYWRQRSPQSLVNEITEIASHYPIKMFSFYDANFFAPGAKGQEHAKQFAKLLLEQKLDVRFTIYSRATDVKEDTFSQLREAGLLRTFIGIESFSPSMLRRWKKGATVEDNLKAIEICQRLGVFVVMGFITFDYDTTLQELQETLAGLKLVREHFPELLPDPSYLFGLLEPLPNTATYEDYRQRRILREDTIEVWSEMFIDNLARYSFKDPCIAEICLFLRKTASYITKQLGQLRLSVQGTTNADPQSRFRFLEQNLKLNNIAISAFEDALRIATTSHSPEVLRKEFQELSQAIEREAVLP